MVHEESRHGLQNDDWVTFEDVQGMVSYLIIPSLCIVSWIVAH
jgi:hypothetical protein